MKKITSWITVLDLVMIAPIQLKHVRCICSHTVLANPELEPLTCTHYFLV